LTVIGFARVGFGALALVWLWLAVMVFPAGLFSIDEFFYVVGAGELLQSGSLIVENGYDRHPSADLSLRFLIPGPHGLTPQYPHGYMILAAPFYGLMGLNGFILLNTLAALGTVALTWRLALAVLGGAKSATLAAAVLALATWLPDYAMGVWPHATATFFTTLAFTLFFLASQRGDGARLALGAGLAGGIALTMRADAVLAAAVLAIWAPAFAARPVRLMLWGTLGALAPLLAASALNQFKFGVFFPLSYGAEGPVSVSGHLGLAPVGLAGIALLVALRRPGFRAALADYRWPLALGVLALGALLIVVVPVAGALAARLGTGFHTLIVDLQNFTDYARYPSISRDDSGYLVFFTIYKKALGQSLPYFALALAALALLWREERRAGVALALATLVVWVLPFIPIQWHGGLSNNMRYFTPALPMMAILFAAGWREVTLWAAEGGARQAPAVLAAIGLLAFSVQWGMRHDIPLPVYAQISLSKHLFLGLAALTALCLFVPLTRPWLAQAARMTAMLGLGLGFMISQVNDLIVNYAVRQRAAAITEANADIPGNSLLYTYVFENFTEYFMRPDTLLAYPTRYGEPVDRDLLLAELASGRRVFALGEMVRDQLLATDPGLRASGLLSDDPAAPRYEILAR
jgi:4-amino-4-deoxy-L-arabinose transferase-like glycosyltransferase